MSHISKLFFVLLGTLINVVFCEELQYLPTMVKSELLKIDDCFIAIQDDDICPRREECLRHIDSKLAEEAFNVCRQKLMALGSGYCETGLYQFAQKEIPSKMYDCEAEKLLGKLTAEDNLGLFRFGKLLSPTIFGKKAQVPIVFSYVRLHACH